MKTKSKRRKKRFLILIIFLSIYTTYKYLEKKKVEITDKELINGQRILHFSVNQNPKENEYILISINEKTTCEDILKDITIKEQIKKRLSSIEGFHFAVINPENKYCELKFINSS